MAANKLISLSKKNNFQEIFKKGSKQHLNKWFLIAYSKNNKDLVKWGFTIPKYVGNAVKRNKIRRWCKEAIRKSGILDKQIDQGMDVNLIFRKKEKDFYKNLRFSDVQSVLQRYCESCFLSNR